MIVQAEAKGASVAAVAVTGNESAIGVVRATETRRVVPLATVVWLALIGIGAVGLDVIVSGGARQGPGSGEERPLTRPPGRFRRRGSGPSTTHGG